MNKLSISLVIVVGALCACGDESDGSVGGGDAGSDAAMLDAMPDATPDAMPDATPDAMLGRFDVGGVVEGLNGALELAFTDGSDNVIQPIEVEPDGTFVVPDVVDGQDFKITVINTPSIQTCEVVNGSSIRIVSGAAIDDILVRCADLLFFAADDGVHGSELWATDGTPNGTQLFVEIGVDDVSSFPSDFVTFEGNIYFAAERGDVGVELWRSDGTKMNTDVYNLRAGDLSSFPQSLRVLNDKLVFVADDGVNGYELWTLSQDGVPELLVEGGIAAGNASGVYGLGPELDGKIFFSGTGSEGDELWMTDGTTTSLVKDIRPGADGSFPAYFVVSGTKLYFIASPDGEVPVVYVSDGTPDGTRPLFEGGSGPTEVYEAPIPITGGVLLINSNSLSDVWFSDGVSRDALFVGSANWVNRYDSRGFGLGFLSLDDGVAGQELFTTDGTMDSLQLIDINEGAGSSNPSVLAQIPAGVLVAADDGIVGRELWLTDGTAPGTQRLDDIFPGAESSRPSSIGTRPEGHVFFANHPDYGREPWISDGTAGGARLLRDINRNGSSDVGDDF